jgi:hypothetical protein
MDILEEQVEEVEIIMMEESQQCHGVVVEQAEMVVVQAEVQEIVMLILQIPIFMIVLEEYMQFLVTPFSIL